MLRLLLLLVIIVGVGWLLFGRQEMIERAQPGSAPEVGASVPTPPPPPPDPVSTAFARIEAWSVNKGEGLLNSISKQGTKVDTSEIQTIMTTLRAASPTTAEALRVKESALAFCSKIFAITKLRADAESRLANPPKLDRQLTSAPSDPQAQAKAELQHQEFFESTTLTQWKETAAKYRIELAELFNQLRHAQSEWDKVKVTAPSPTPGVPILTAPTAPPVPTVP